MRQSALQRPIAADQDHISDVLARDEPSYRLEIRAPDLIVSNFDVSSSALAKCM